MHNISSGGGGGEEDSMSPFDNWQHFQQSLLKDRTSSDLTSEDAHMDI